MAKPRSFRCRALFTWDLAPKCEGHGWGGEGRGERCWGPGSLDLGRPRRDPACEVPRPVPARRGSPRFGSRVGTHILGFGVGPPRTGSRVLGRVGWAGGAFSSRFSSRGSKEPLMATSGTPQSSVHTWSNRNFFFFSLFILSPPKKRKVTSEFKALVCHSPLKFLEPQFIFPSQPVGLVKR